MSSRRSPSPPTSTTADVRSSGERSSYTCPTYGCNQSFSTSNELAIHKQKHQMTLKLGPKTGLADMLPFDQTPTPTKFLQYGKETGLFDEISNPFDSEFKRSTSSQSLKEKARRSAIPQLIINNGMNKPRTPTSYPLPGCYAQVAQPVHVITLTPTLPSPVGALPGGQFFLPSPQGFIPGLGLSATSPALISPSIVPFSAPGLPFPMQAVVEAQQAAFTQAFINAAAAATSQHSSATMEQMSMASHSHPIASRTSSVPSQANVTIPFPTQTVSVPVHSNNHGANMASPPIGSASVIQQRGQVNMNQQRRTLTESNSLDLPTLPISSGLERKASFPGETSVITQAPNSAVTSQMSSINMNPNSMGYQYMPQQQSNMATFPQVMAERPSSVSSVGSHPVLTASRSVPTTQNNINLQNIPTLPHQNSLPTMDAKQKLKETLTNNNPNLQMELSSMDFHDMDMEEELNDQNEVTSSSGMEHKTPGRRRGRQHSQVDPDRKRMRFLERNRAAASRCRAKKKQWVSGLEVKAKDLNMNNINLQNEVASLREEVASLKQLLLAHRDCPITRVQHQKLVIAGADPSAVVSNTIQAAASLLGTSSDDMNENMMEDIKPNNGMNIHQPLTHKSSTGSVGEDSHGSNSYMMQGANMIGKTEQIGNNFPTPVISQSSNTSTIVLNNNYSSSSSLSSTSST